jgi:hypothetical protein
VRQRIFQIACGYEDQNDSNSLSFDPLLKLVCGFLAETGGELASQPTISRLENSVTVRAFYEIAEMLLGLYAKQRGKCGASKKIVLAWTQPTIPPIYRAASWEHGRRVVYKAEAMFQGTNTRLRRL